jgi:hypothetical protein
LLLAVANALVDYVSHQPKQFCHSDVAAASTFSCKLSCSSCVILAMFSFSSVALLKKYNI